MNTKDELRKMCEGIVDDLIKVSEGTYWTEEEQAEREANCENCDMWGYFVDDNSILDIKYVVDSPTEYNSVILMVAWGGPNVYIDTYRGTVRGYWGVDSVEVDLPHDIIGEIDSVWEELYHC